MPWLQKALDVGGNATLLMIRRRISIISSLCIPAFFIFHLLTFGKLEFRTEQSNSVFYHGSFALFAILILVLTIALPEDYAGQIGRTLGIFGIFILGVFWFLFYFAHIGEDSVKEDRRILYVKKSNSNERIIEQVYYTGITRSNMNMDTILTKNVIGSVRWTKSISLESIDTAEWVQVQPNYR